MFADKDIQRFWSKVDRKDDTTACWDWTGGMCRHGYGKFKANRKDWRSHRVAIMIHLNREIITGMYVLHACDNRKCCNPHHLREGTNDDNMRDMRERKRCPGKRGESSPTSKLTTAEVLTIRERYSRGDISQHQLARDYNCNVVNIHNIVHRKSWTHI